MGTLMKLVIGTAAGLFLVLAVVLFKSGEHTAKQDVRHAQFQGNFATAMQQFAKNPAEKKMYERQAAAAFQDLSSAKTELTSRKAKSKQTVDQNLDNILKDMDKPGGGK